MNLRTLACGTILIAMTFNAAPAQRISPDMPHLEKRDGMTKLIAERVRATTAFWKSSIALTCTAIESMARFT